MKVRMKDLSDNGAKMKGVYKHGKRYRVRKYGAHLGCYDTIEEAEQVALEAEQYHKGAA